MRNYDDIINLPHHVSPTRKQMSLSDRSAQFSPFSALTGYDEVISETARLTDARIELDENELEKLNKQLIYIRENIKNKPQVSITYFVLDELKEGGAYVTVCGFVKKIDEFSRTLLLEDASTIPIDDVFEIIII